MADFAVAIYSRKNDEIDLTTQTAADEHDAIKAAVIAAGHLNASAWDQHFTKAVADVEGTDSSDLPLDEVILALQDIDDELWVSVLEVPAEA